MKRKKKSYSVARGIYLMLCAKEDIDCAESARWYYLWMFICPPFGLVFYPEWVKAVHEEKLFKQRAR